MQEPRMANLPPERLKTCPPFTYVGPWSITTRQTYKRRTGREQAVGHNVLLYELQSCAHRSHHINGCIKLRQCSKAFFCNKRTCQTTPIRSKFLGACKELGMSKNQPEANVQWYLHQAGCSWEFNPPHASDMGGS
ncbi:hypothetical protein DPEC_G00302820 [Dallia pectoralis]|uniref:Uncharacterized protein n=1 Tax=Dallia pectoralis TaxID=75939 RepID=A0ACC2FH16_DALPE|nr:hypothetical protein DPEC_G00302820 [Dallia pectoralis]